MIFLGIPILDETRHEHANRRTWTTADFSVTFLSWVTTQRWAQGRDLDFYAMGWEL